MSMPRSRSVGPDDAARARAMKAVTAIVRVGGLAKVGTCVWNSEGTYIPAMKIRIMNIKRNGIDFASSFLAKNLFPGNPTIVINEIYPVL
jgi:hypothetical protein